MRRRWRLTESTEPEQTSAPQAAPLPYLERLTVRLATGVAQLDERTRQRHAQFLLAAQRDDGGFAGREGPSDLYYTGFALRSLAILGQLDGPVAQRAATFLAKQLHAQVPIIDFLSLVYSGRLLELAAGVDVFADAASEWRRNVAGALERFRRADGGYAKADEGQSSSTYYSFLMVLCLQLIGQPVVEPDKLLGFVRGRQRLDGGFVELGPMQRSGTNPTAAAVGLQLALGALEPSMRNCVIDFLAEMQTDEGGLRANTRIPIADLLSTFTGLLTLVDLQATETIDLAEVARYVQSLEVETGGFLGAEWDSGTDVEYAFYGLGALALLKTLDANAG
ncbi:MAG: terpene cyclase/mutase family protein [Planctomycetes bacterium]|nr:terpene cyclase/mutase family protein [Planctomycetota bacterium]